MSAEGRFSSIEEFENVILRTEPNGTSVRLKDVARVELGLQDYAFDVRLDDQPVSGFGVTLLPGANALEVADAVKARMDELQKEFPPGVEWFVALDATTFITHAINEVIFTLCAAVVLVFIVMLIFLQSFRATLIPTLVVPVALMGAFIGMEIFGFSINQLTLFGMVLAIGIVVDDAIVVIESVERLMREEHLSPRDATRKAMDQITSPIIAISLVLAAVFVPAAMQTGSVGVIYQQFALTIAISMLFSAFLALSLTPALCATLLRPEHLKENRFFGMFNRGYDWVQSHYLTSVKFSLRHKTWWLASFGVLLLVGGYLFYRVPGSFVPDEDQGYAIGIVAMPPGSTIQRTREVMRRVGEKIRKSPSVDSVFEVAGFGFSGSDESAGIFFVRLKELEDRDETAEEFINWTYGNISGAERDGGVFFVNMPVIQGLSNFGGFDMRLEDRGNKGTQALIEAQNLLLAKAAQSKIVQGVRYDGFAPAPRLELKLDRSAGAVDGARDRRRLQRDPDHVRAGVRERLLLPGPRAARADAGGCEVPHERGRAQPLLSTGRERGEQRLRAQRRDHERRHGAARLGRVVEVGGRAAHHPAVQRLRRHEHHGPERGRIQLRPGDGGNAAHRERGPAARIRHRLGRSVTAGDPGRCRSALALRPVDLRGVPVPGRALRELGDALGGAAGGARGHHRRHRRRRVDGSVQRRVLQDRPHHHHRPVREKRHPDRGVRAAGPAKRQARCTRPSWKPRACDSAPF